MEDIKMEGMGQCHQPLVALPSASMTCATFVEQRTHLCLHKGRNIFHAPPMD